MLDYYVKEMLDRTGGNPWITTPEIWKYITLGGPFVRPRGVMHLFGGFGQCWQTCRRMDALRRAAIMGRENELPRRQELQTQAEICERIDANRRDEYLLLRFPDIWNGGPYDGVRRQLPPDSLVLLAIAGGIRRVF